MQTVFDAIPTSQAIRVIVNSLSGEQLFTRTRLSFVVMAVWTIAAYAIPVRRLGAGRAA